MMTIKIKLNRIERIKKTKKKVTQKMMINNYIQTHNFIVQSPNHTYPRCKSETKANILG